MSAVNWITHMQAEMAAPSTIKTNAATANEMELKARLSEGLTATSVSAWNDLIADFDLYNDTLEGTTKYYRDDAKAVALEEVLESHSVDVWARFGLEKTRIESFETTDVVNSITRSALDLTNEAATLALSAAEGKKKREDAQARASGSALAAKADPRKRDKKRRGDTPGQPKAPWTAPTKWSEGMRYCRNCAEDPIDGGKHLDKDCPRKSTGGANGGAKLSGGKCLGGCGHGDADFADALFAALGGMADLGGIVLDKFILIKRLRERSMGAIVGMPDALTITGKDMMTVPEVHTFTLQVGLMLNKTEFENIFEHFGTTDTGGVQMVDMRKFVDALTTVPAGAEPMYYTELPPSPNKTHLALSGVSHIEFGQQYKAFPAHWGVPPNAQMKGHDGIVRDLPCGYGKGNGPMEKWVKENMEHDERNGTDGYGRKPYPFGNYSLGSKPQAL